MNRRSFLKAAVAAPVAAVLPGPPAPAGSGAAVANAAARYAQARPVATVRVWPLDATGLPITGRSFTMHPTDVQWR